MKTLVKITILSGLILIVSSIAAQTTNWASLNDENKHILSVQVGLDYGVVYGLGYGYRFKTRLFPVIGNIEYSFPSGKTITDDFKTKIGGQVRLIELHDFRFSTKIYGVYRRFENDFVRMNNLGSDLTAVFGYYRPKWFVSAEVGFDKAIATNLRHTSTYSDVNKDVADGWYKPATGGNFYYGLRSGVSFGKNDICFGAGKIHTQNFKTSLMVPFYLQLGYNRRF